MCDTAFNEWKSLYNDEIADTWKSERTELRKIAMLMQALKLEVEKTQTEVNNKLSHLKEQLKVIDKQEHPESPPVAHEQEHPESPPVAHKVNSPSNSVNTSPKLNKYLKISRLKRLSTSPSLLASPKNSKSGVKTKKLQSKRLLSPLIVEGSPDAEPSSKRKKEFLHPLCLTGKAQDLDLDNTVVDKSVPKKRKAKTSYLKKIRDSHQDNTLTQTFSNFFSTETKKSDLHEPCTTLNKQIKKRKSAVTKGTRVKHTNDESICVSDDDEIILITEHSKTNKNELPLVKKTSPAKTRSASPESKNVHKTSPVKRKADKMKLPGRTCVDCETFYKDLDLSLQELQQKLNKCSKHRNESRPLDETREGFWDLTMKLTQEDTKDDSNIFNF